MDLCKISLPAEILDRLEDAYIEFKRIDPKLNRNYFILSIFDGWLKQFDKQEKIVYKKNEVVLRNNVREAIKWAGKTQTQVAEEIGIDRTYLGRIIKGEYDPSVTLALLIVRATGYPATKFTDIFYLEPAED